MIEKNAWKICDEIQVMLLWVVGNIVGGYNPDDYIT